jgi:hypothetical protein
MLSRHSMNCSVICCRMGVGTDHQVVGQQHGEGLVADQALRAQHRMPRPSAWAWRT